MLSVVRRLLAVARQRRFLERFQALREQRHLGFQRAEILLLTRDYVTELARRLLEKSDLGLDDFGRSDLSLRGQLRYHFGRSTGLGGAARGGCAETTPTTINPSNETAIRSSFMHSPPKATAQQKIA
jgi:hypothetical protein